MSSEPKLFSRDVGGPYEPLIDDLERDCEDGKDLEAVRHVDQQEFSLIKYFCFFVVGLSMMWTWSMILQAVPFFQRRFRGSPWILRYFQAFYLVFFAFTMLAVTLYLGMQFSRPSYTKRLHVALTTYVVVSTLLMLSTLSSVATTPYFAFTLIMVVATAVANGLSQNAAFAFAARFGRTEYAPAIMTGEALAGLLPSTIGLRPIPVICCTLSLHEQEIGSALAFPSEYFDVDVSETGHTSWLTLSYFLSAAVVGVASIHALQYLARHAPPQTSPKVFLKSSNYTNLASKLRYPASANFLCLCISSVSPVFISKITSVVPIDNAHVLSRPQAFIPMAIVLWNIGDFLGSVLAVRSLFLLRYPGMMVGLSLARLGFIPLYLMCNIDGRGSAMGDWFYLIIVQFLFGLSHGWLSGASMMGVTVWVGEEEREEAGAFMGMTLVIGLVAGSLLGLLAAQA
ncbi:related to intracellular membrane protein involved in nucleoside transport [Phialocephala subalpina]|uniref:Related to intracellular membrane protein involved in nucleoside transport n=1 Tax=Phialocephala subalpina TaxID=576137 RepID=A0A1L7WRN1_9HELO|nr:related to intracellular membrane protein involved in nucleoside transport [Phialocephala subalpina]